MNESEALLRLIQQEVRRCLTNEKHLVRKYPAIVTGIMPDGKIQVNLYEDETPYLFFNKSGVSLVKGDSVFVEAVGNSLTNGFISEKFGK